MTTNPWNVLLAHVECPECHGRGGFVSTAESLGGTLPGWADCKSCTSKGPRLGRVWLFPEMLEECPGGCPDCKDRDIPVQHKPHPHRKWWGSQEVTWLPDGCPTCRGLGVVVVKDVGKPLTALASLGFDFKCQMQGVTERKTIVLYAKDVLTPWGDGGEGDEWEEALLEAVKRVAEWQGAELIEQ